MAARRLFAQALGKALSKKDGPEEEGAESAKATLAPAVKLVPRPGSEGLPRSKVQLTPPSQPQAAPALPRMRELREPNQSTIRLQERRPANASMGRRIHVVRRRQASEESPEESVLEDLPEESLEEEAVGDLDFDFEEPPRHEMEIDSEDLGSPAPDPIRRHQPGVAEPRRRSPITASPRSKAAPAPTKHTKPLPQRYECRADSDSEESEDASDRSESEAEEDGEEDDDSEEESSDAAKAAKSKKALQRKEEEKRLKAAAEVKKREAKLVEERKQAKKKEAVNAQKEEKPKSVQKPKEKAPVKSKPEEKRKKGDEKEELKSEKEKKQREEDRERGTVAKENGSRRERETPALPRQDPPHDGPPPDAESQFPPPLPTSSHAEAAGPGKTPGKTDNSTLTFAGRKLAPIPQRDGDSSSDYSEESSVKPRKRKRKGSEAEEKPGQRENRLAQHTRVRASCMQEE